MTGLAAQFGPGLLALSLATPLAVLALFLVPGQRALARAITPLAALPALAAAILAIGGAPFGVELPALRVSLWLDQPGRAAAARGGARLAHRQHCRLPAPFSRDR